MFHKGARVGGGNLPPEIISKIEALLDEFTANVQFCAMSTGIRRAVVRSNLPCSVVYLLDSEHLFVAAQKAFGMPSTLGLDFRGNSLSINQVYDDVKWEYGFDDPFVISFPAALLDQTMLDRGQAIVATAMAHIESEVSRVERQTNMIQINPVFGPASFVLDPRLAFVLMPFTDELTKIYSSIIKPTVEKPEFRLVCHRADDIKSNKAIIQDIWKSICEARLVIADLSRLNPNVMYELGIAHTVGKETILIYQSGDNVKFPFDLAHIRRIEYRNDAPGGKQLEFDLTETIRQVLQPRIKTL
ncbi:MAG: hypothetical protein AABZ47_00725 [Planctomycetota bacterium]